MEMAAGLLFRRAAGMKNRNTLLRRQTRQFQFLERSGRDSRNLRPMINALWCELARLAGLSICGVVFELKREKLQSELIEHRVPTPGGQRFFAALTDWGIDEAMPSSKNGLAQSRGEG